MGHTIDHLLRQGVTRVIAVDNLSTDNTRSVLDAKAAQDPRVLVGRDVLDEWHQGAKTSYLVDLARLGGADWVIPCDADEFWFAPEGTVQEWLSRRRDGARVVSGQMHDLLPANENGIDLHDPATRVRPGEAPGMKKVAIRPRGWTWVEEGNHGVAGQDPDAGGLLIAHVPHRSFEQFERKVTVGAAAMARAGYVDGFGTHWHDAANAGTDERQAQWRRTVSSTGPSLPAPTQWPTWSLPES